MIYYLLPFLLFLNTLLGLPTQEFIEHHSTYPIYQRLYTYGMTQKDLNLFKKMVQAEDESFIGYHAGCSSYMLFQDIIRVVVEEKLDFPVRRDFHFLRIPGTEELHYPSADAFIKQFINKYPGLFIDEKPETQIHILSLNIALYQSYDAPWDLTPRYYLENKPWTSPDYWSFLKEFFKQAGLDENAVLAIVDTVTTYFPQNRGFIMQFFDPTKDHSFLETHFYASHSGGLPLHAIGSPLYLILHPLLNKQLRLVIDNAHILNPFSTLKIKRYDLMTDEEREHYEDLLRQLIRAVRVIDPKKNEGLRQNLSMQWS